MALGPDYDVDTHFTPRYNPWDQRLCLVPDADLFQAISGERASVVTDHIETFTQDRHPAEVRQELEADIIVTATGLVLEVLAAWRSASTAAPSMRADAELQGHDVFRRAEHGLGLRLHQRVLDAEVRPDVRVRLPPAQPHGPARLQAGVAHNAIPTITELPWLDFSSGYVQRAIAKFPKQGSKRPWRLYQNYALDLVTLRYGKIEDGVMRYS